MCDSDLELFIHFINNISASQYFLVDKIIRIVQTRPCILVEVSWKGFSREYNTIVSAKNFRNKKVFRQMLLEFRSQEKGNFTFEHIE